MFKNCIICKNNYKATSAPQKVCISCRKEYRLNYKKQWRANNIDKCHEQEKMRYWNNLERSRAQKRKWNKTKGIKYREEYYSIPENRIKRNKLSSKYRKEQASRIKARSMFIESEAQLKCYCDKTKVEIHHVDGNVFNNDLNNLSPLCLEHHKLIHCHKRLQRYQSPISS